MDWDTELCEVDGQAAVSVSGVWRDDRDEEWRLDYVWTVVNGRVECVAFSVAAATPGRRLTQDIIRRLPIARLQEEIRRFPPADLERLVITKPWFKQGELAQHGLGMASKPAADGPGPQRYDVEFFRQVAEIYRGSLSKPTQAVADHFGVGPSTASSWVRRARLRGLLEPSDRRRRRSH